MSYGEPQGRYDVVYIETRTPEREDEEHQVMHRWYWDGPTNKLQAFCGPWKLSRQEAERDGEQWLRTGVR